MQTSRARRIEAILTQRLHPTQLVVSDDSARHAGHAGASAAGETHYNLLVVSDAFTGKNRVARHRMVQDALAAEFSSGLHALSMTLRTPDEQAAASPTSG